MKLGVTSHMAWGSNLIDSFVYLWESVRLLVNVREKVKGCDLFTNLSVSVKPDKSPLLCYD